MKVIDLLNRMENGDKIPNKIKLECVNNITENNCIYKFNPLLENYVNDDNQILSNATCLATLLGLKVKIIEKTIDKQ